MSQAVGEAARKVLYAMPTRHPSGRRKVPLCAAATAPELALFIVVLVVLAVATYRALWLSPWPLFFAASRGGPSQVRAALRHGWQVNGRDGDGNGPALVVAAASGRAANVRVLLRAGADVNAVNQHGNTALILAASHGRSDIVDVLLAAGARPGITNRSGERAADAARREGHLALASLLDRAVAASGARP
jgi:uncharacterized protein